MRVLAIGNVLGLRAGEVADFPASTPELDYLIELGFLNRTDAQGRALDEPPPRRSCCGG